MNLVEKHVTERGGAVDPRQIPAEWAARAPEYCALLAAGNGLVLAGRQWRLFGVGAGRIGRDAREWNAAAWRAAYSLPPSLLVCAENVFGDQLAIAIDAGGIVRIDCEGGRVERLPSPSLSACLEELVTTPQADDVALVEAARAQGLVPTLLEHLSFSLPLICGGSATSDNLELLDGEAHLELLGQIIEQTRDIPEGTPIKRFTP